MRAAAAAVLSRHGALELALRLDGIRTELSTTRRDLSRAGGLTPWWERDASTVQDPTRVAPLEARVAVLEGVEQEVHAALEAALDAAQGEMPPIEIARRVSRCIDLARTAGLGVSVHDDALITELEALAERVLAIWAPGLVPDDATEMLMDPANAAAAATSDHGSVRADAVLGWAPASPSEIVARAARALHRPDVAAARERVAREYAEYESCAARLREMRKAASTWRQMTGDGFDEARAIERAEQQAQVEQHELTAAWEALHHAVGHALAATPPLHVARTAVATAGILRARFTTWEIVVAMVGHAPGTMMFMRSVSRRGRAVMFAALRELKAATEAAFPGLLVLLTPRGAKAAVREEASVGPYRQRPEADPPEAGPTGADLVTEVIARAAKSGLDARVGAIVAHGAALGALSRRSRRVVRERSLFGRIGAWVSSEDDPLEARERWHRALAFSMLDQAELAVAHARRGLFVLDFRAALAGAAAQFFSIWVSADHSLFDVTCAIRRQDEAIAALEEARRVLVSAWGDAGDRMALIQELVAYLGSGTRNSSPFASGGPRRRLHRHELVVGLAEQLRGSAFLDAAARVVDANHRWLDASRRAAEAEARITFWDQLNVFTDSDAETAKKAQMALGEQVYRDGKRAFAEVDQLLEGALAFYPPAAVLYRVEEATAAVAAMRALKVVIGSGKSARYECHLWGGPQANAAFTRLATSAFHAFGPMLSDTEILAAHWERALDAETSARGDDP